MHVSPESEHFERSLQTFKHDQSLQVRKTRLGISALCMGLVSGYYSVADRGHFNSVAIGMRCIGCHMHNAAIYHKQTAERGDTKGLTLRAR